jgi:hypothetical protein
MDDPIVAEIHRTREKLLQECDGDIEKLMDRLESREKTDRSRVADPSHPQPPLSHRPPPNRA